MSRDSLRSAAYSGLVAPRRLHLNDGADPQNALAVLKDAIAQPNTWGFPNDPVNYRIKYLEWTEAVEAQFLNLTSDPEVIQMFQTARHWHIHSSDTTSLARLHPLIQAEVAAQRADLERLAQDLTERIARATAAPGQIAVVDSNILLEHVAPADVNWQEVVRADQIRLVVPLRVVEEVDAKKYVRRSDLADRARRALPALQKVIGAGGAPGKLREGVTIEVPVDPGPRRRPDDADREVLDTCHEMRQLSGGSVGLVTADTGIRLRGEGEGVTVAPMPAKYERQRD